MPPFAGWCRHAIRIPAAPTIVDLNRFAMTYRFARWWDSIGEFQQWAQF